MKYCLPLVTWVLILTAFTDVKAQLNIDYPTSRAVFQRDKNNSATIYVSGSFTKVVDRIEAKLTPINGGNNVDWITIHANPQGGFFAGSISSTGGWYNLEVRGMRGDQKVGEHSVSPIGIGEVFLIAGQSNGQGFVNKDGFDFGAQRANDDRVSCIDFNNHNSSTSALPYPSFTHLESDTQISPRGLGAWSWGKLGDLLANRLQVPILFYNVAWDGTIVRSWRESITGTARSPYIEDRFVPYEPSGAPYSNLRSVLQYYVPITGVRGVLWIQGEGDNHFNTSSDSYASDLQAVINASRNESGKNISWMVSLTSYSDARVAPGIIDAQKKVISTVSNVFTGPNTDVIQIPRTDKDKVHFHHEGLTTLAEAWNNQLNDDYFSRSEPYKAVSQLQVTASCAGNNNVSLSVNSNGYSNINWSTGSNSSTIQVGNGTYRVTARDAKGNVIFSPEIRINEPITPSQPQVTLQGSNPVCLGNTAVLISSTNDNIRWNNGATNDHLTVTTGGEYFVTTRNVYGCESSSSKTNITILTSPLPEKPTISASGAVTFCDGGEVNLQSNSKVNNLWSNGANTGSIQVRSSGEFRVRAVDNLGCFSPESDPVTVKVNALPAKPAINLSGPSDFCEGGNVSLTSSYDNGNTWSNSAVDKTITVNQSGTFTLKQRDSNGCESNSDPVTIKVNPLPATPSITTLRPTTFCLRDFTTLRSSETHEYLWSNGAGGQEVNIYESGNYTISARDQNGCVSKPSAGVQVTVNPLPPTPVITADGPTVFCADLSVNLQSTTANSFLWSNGSTSQSIKVTKDGTYSVQTINQFQCYSDRSNEIGVSTLALPPAPLVTPLSATTFCDGDFVALQASNGANFIWNTGSEKDSIHVLTSGAYSARVKDLQGCLSPFSSEITVDVKPSPTPPTIRKIGVFTLLAENNINDGDHVWKLEQTVLPETGTTLKAVKSGSYVVNNTVVYSPTLTCFSDYSAPFVFVADDKNNGMVAYPNPLTDGKLLIETVQDIVNAEVQIIDIRGVIHKTYRTVQFDQRQIFNISDLASGIYIVRIVSSTFNASQKFIVVR
ncbi:T9SS type A sorting domain-containing protein [Dyadobacter sp. CY312]|uniref:T9SS type A sorting domain-containing protein n=1 Tax=Dyadobacter sp. CY312 TaxID=2907303 RepID=UPI001F17D900|nr:T9SS type A sorting domain-containing protein [Dyadobacter sp. CY312]MCE7042289.1 T9SS type A sorting domain-containing protein [Dyadobacter sp. CY312]